MTASQRLGKFAIPFRVPLFFSPRMARVTLQKPLPGIKNGVHAWPLTTWGISPSLVDSCVDCMAGEVTLSTRTYSANRPQPSLVRECIVVQNKWPIPEQVTSVFVNFSAQFLHPITIIRCCHTCSRWNSICHDDSSVIISKDHLLDLWLHSSKFFRSQGGWTSPLDCDFNSGSNSLTHVSSIATIQHRNAWPTTSDLSFSNVAMSRRFCFCSAVKQWGTHRA
jgi:hypothetical protein